MKIAIQGHPTRGKEVIQILESLGGKNDGLHEGNNPDCYYELHGNIIWCVSTKGINFKYYTLEEFEEEFPFKIGDKVIHKEYDSLFEIIEFDPENVYPYRIDGLCEFRTKSCTLTKYQPKMKEERNITLTLDKAKEWYKKGGELKEIALQAFTEKELTKVELPKTWKEFCDNYPAQAGECWLGSCDQILENDSKEDRTFRNWIPSRKSAEAHLAMIQLEQLRDCWRQGWKPKMHECVYTIKFANNGLNVYSYVSREFLSFPTREMAEEFLKCFRDLIEKAGDLI